MIVQSFSLPLTLSLPLFVPILLYESPSLSLLVSPSLSKSITFKAKSKDCLDLFTFSLACRRPIMMAIPTARAHNTPAVLYTKLLGVRYSSMCQLPVPVRVCVWVSVWVCVSCGEKFHYLRVTIICRYIYGDFGLKHNLRVLNFAICMWKWYRVYTF